MKEKIEQIISNFIELKYNLFWTDKLIGIISNIFDYYKSGDKYKPLICKNCDKKCNGCYYEHWKIADEIAEYFNSHDDYGTVKIGKNNFELTENFLIQYPSMTIHKWENKNCVFYKDDFIEVDKITKLLNEDIIAGLPEKYKSYYENILKENKQ